MSHLEDLIREFYEWQGYIVRRNIKVGRLGHGGWEGELDLVVYYPEKPVVIHIEPSLDSHSWKRRETRFAKKFEIGKKYILQDVFPWLDDTSHFLKQQAVLSCGATRKALAGGEVIPLDDLAAQIKRRIKEEGKMEASAIPEQFPLLRTIQLIVSGYSRKPDNI